MGDRALYSRSASGRRGDFSADSGGDSLTVDDVERYGASWRRDGEYRQLSPATLAARALLIDKLVWWLRSQEKKRVDRCELREFLAYASAGKDADGGRWGSGAARARASKIKPSTVATYYRILRGFFAWLVEEEILDASPIATLRPPVVRQDQVTPFTVDQVRALLAAAGGTRHARRDVALIHYLLDTGSRADEVCSLLIGDLSLTEGWAHIRHGKGGKARRVRLGPRARRALGAYIREGGRRETDPVFLAEGGWKEGDGLTPSGLRQAIERWGQIAGVRGVRCSTHTFRHTFAVEFLKNGGNQFSLMEMLGHTSVAMTKRYVHYVDADMETAHQKFSPVESMLGPKTKGRRD